MGLNARANSTLARWFQHSDHLTPVGSPRYTIPPDPASTTNEVHLRGYSIVDDETVARLCSANKEGWPLLKSLFDKFCFAWCE